MKLNFWKNNFQKEEKIIVHFTILYAVIWTMGTHECSFQHFIVLMLADFIFQVTDKTLLQEVVNGSTTIKDGRIKSDEYIYMVLEYGEIDLAHMLSQKWKEMNKSGWKLDENWLRFYWQVLNNLP